MNLKQCKVLIVDDIKANINILAKTLENSYDIEFVQDGEETLKIVKEKVFDLILLDILMPGMDGYEVCKKLKSDPETKDIPVIFITAMKAEENESKGLELGAVDYITKPFCKPIVKMRVKNHLMLKLQRDLLKNLSNLDGLTGIPNRRNFDERIDLEWRRAHRSDSVLSVIMIDIDFFKKYNDNYGHSAGDDCLKKIAVALETSLLRSSDFIARYGGEEFVAILPETDSYGAKEVAERMRDNVLSLQIKHAFSSVMDFVTISQGAASTIPCANAIPLTLIDAADKALYEAKKNGRNVLKFKEQI